MDWNRVDGNWKQIRRKIKEKWDKLTDDELMQIDGKRDQFEGKLQEHYGIAKDRVRQDVDNWLSSMDYSTSGWLNGVRQLTPFSCFSTTFMSIVAGVRADGEKPSPAATGFARRLYSTQQNQDNNDYQDQAQPTARIVAPAGAVRPSWQGADQQQNEDDNDNGP